MQFKGRSKGSPQLARLAQTFIEVIPRSMWAIRYGMRSAAGAEFTVPQFRTMALLWRQPRTNGDLAEQLGTSVPAMSRLVDGLVTAGYLAREPQSDDRRRIQLKLTPKGRRRFLQLRATAHKLFLEKFSNLDSDRQAKLAAGFSILEELFP